MSERDMQPGDLWFSRNSNRFRFVFSSEAERCFYILFSDDGFCLKKRYNPNIYKIKGTVWGDYQLICAT